MRAFRRLVLALPVTLLAASVAAADAVRRSTPAGGHRVDHRAERRHDHGRPRLLPARRSRSWGVEARASPAQGGADGRARARGDDRPAVRTGAARANGNARDPDRAAWWDAAPRTPHRVGYRDGDLDAAFTAATSSRIIRARAAQVTYTLTQFANVSRVRILVGGKALPPIAGLPTGNFTRTTFRDEWLPAIFVDRPAWGSVFESGARVSGVTNVFEAQFRLQVIAANGG